MYGLIKTHKDNSLVRMIIGGRGTAIEFLKIFAEKHFIRK